MPRKAIAAEALIDLRRRLGTFPPRSQSAGASSGSGLETPEGLVRAPKGVLKTPTVNAYLKHWGLDWRTLRREPPAVRLQAQHSNELWQFDISASDLKQLKAPAWVGETKGQPTLMLYSVVDDRSGVASLCVIASLLTAAPWPGLLTTALLTG